MTAMFKKIDENTSVSFKIVVPIVSTIAVGAWMISAQLADIKSKIADGWSTKQQAEWSGKLRAQNPALTVPDIYEVKQR